MLEVVTDPAGQMISSPYEVTFYSFTVELADALIRLRRAPNGFLVKAIQVEPEDSKMAEAPVPTPVATTLPVAPPGTPQTPIEGRSRIPRPPPPTPTRPAPAPAAGRPQPSDKPVRLLREKRLKITLLVYALKPAK